MHCSVQILGKVSGNEIVIVSIKPALTNHLDMVTPLSDIHLLHQCHNQTNADRDIHRHVLAVLHTTMHIHVDIEQRCLHRCRCSNGPIRVRFQFVELAVWECTYASQRILYMYYSRKYTQPLGFIASHVIDCTKWWPNWPYSSNPMISPQPQLKLSHNEHMANEQNQIR